MGSFSGSGTVRQFFARFFRGFSGEYLRLPKVIHVVLGVVPMGKQSQLASQPGVLQNKPSVPERKLPFKLDEDLKSYSKI